MAEEEKELKEPEVVTAEAMAAEQAPGEAMLDMIVNKEEEIRKRIENARKEAERRVEVAKLDAAALKREADTLEVGKEMREEEMEKARKEAERVMEEAAVDAEKIRNQGMERVEEAVDIVIRGVLPRIERD